MGQKTFFQLDAPGVALFERFSDGTSSNGWSASCCTSYQAQKIVAVWQNKGWIARRDENLDAFLFSINGEAQEIEEFLKTEVEGEPLDGIGAGSWIWEEVLPTAVGKA